MTDDYRRKPPPGRLPRFPRPVDPETVRVSEDKPPDTLKTWTPPTPIEPFRALKGREASYTEIAAQLQGVGAAVGQVITTQKQQAQQLDGFGRLINERFDIFHRELALLRATVTGDHEPRLGKVEDDVAEVVKLTPKQKAKLGAVITAKLGAGGAVLLLVGGPVLRAVSRAFPEYSELIDGILDLVGL